MSRKRTYVRDMEPFGHWSEVWIPDRMRWPDGRLVKDLPKAERVDAEGYCAYDYGGYNGSWASDGEGHEIPYRRVWVRCPLCNRRVIARVRFFDGERSFVVPRHKPHGYRIPVARHHGRDGVGRRISRRRD